MQISRKKIKIKKGVITCEFCTAFNTATRRYGTIRECSPGKKVDKDTGSCDEFDLYPYFYCGRGNARLDLAVCSSRQEKEKEGCINCKKGKQIKEMLSILGG